MTVGVDAVRHRVAVDEDVDEVASARSALSIRNY
jgi:hypothetical protein